MWTSAFVSLGYLPRSGVAGSCDDSVSLDLDELPGRLQSSCTSLQPHQQHVRVRVVFQHLIITRVSLLKMDSPLPLERSGLVGWSQLPSTRRRVDWCCPPPLPNPHEIGDHTPARMKKALAQSLSKSPLIFDLLRVWRGRGSPEPCPARL